MGATPHTGGGGNYYTVADGKLIKRVKEPTAFSKERTTKTGKQVHEEIYKDVSGRIVSATLRDGVIRVRFPKSISFKLCKSDEFQPVKRKVFDLLCNVICPGTTPEELMQIRYSRPRLRKQKQVEAVDAEAVA
jgi:hypothetical protein